MRIWVDIPESKVPALRELGFSICFETKFWYFDDPDNDLVYKVRNYLCKTPTAKVVKEIKKSNTKIQIYTDGACERNPGGRGGWGWGFVICDYEGKTIEHCGGELITTSNRMELTAAIKAIEFFGNKRVSLHIHTDSKYLVDGVSKWLKSWKAKGWKGAGKQDIKNLDLWMKIDHLTQKHSVSWGWVKGHSGIAGNERADKLANAGMFTFDS
jgi:ribonuclease HI